LISGGIDDDLLAEFININKQEFHKENSKAAG
jgi:hypothetical protein